MKRLINISKGYDYIDENINLRKIRNEIYFYNSNKNWIFQDLETLIESIKNAVKEKNEKLLRRYISRREFNIQLFQMSKSRKWSYNELDISRRWTWRILFEDALEDFSGKDEAYLKSKNWNFSMMRTWFFYFKRVHYPFDNQINGGWEWCGIFLGNRF